MSTSSTACISNGSALSKMVLRLYGPTRLTINVDGSVVSTGPEVQGTQRGFNLGLLRDAQRAIVGP